MSTPITKNGITFLLERKETAGRQGTDGTAYWDLPSGAKLAGLTDEERKLFIACAGEQAGALAAAMDRIISAYTTLLGREKVLEYIEARLTVAMRSSQLDQGKDAYSMDEKFSRAVDYIAADFGRNRTGGISALTTKLSVAQQITRLQGELIAKYQSMVAAPAADRDAIQQQIDAIMQQIAQAQSR